MNAWRGVALTIVALGWGCAGGASPQPGWDVSAAREPAASAVPDPSHGGAMAHGDHRPHYGGLVMMNGDLHFEVVATPGGAYHVYFSDELRRDLPASTVSEVVLTITRSHGPVETLIPGVDDAGESWLAQGKPLDDPQVTIRVAYVYEDKPYWIDIPWTASLPAGKISAT